MSGARTIVTAAAAALLTIAVPAAAQETSDVDVVDIDFAPAEVTVEAGTTVTWTQSGSLPHTVTADDGSFDSHPDCSSAGDACMASGDTFTQTFDEPGEYAYYCRLHGSPGGDGMSGVVMVTAAGADTPTEAAADDDGLSGTGVALAGVALIAVVAAVAGVTSVRRARRRATS